MGEIKLACTGGKACGFKGIELLGLGLIGLNGLIELFKTLLPGGPDGGGVIGFEVTPSGGAVWPEVRGGVRGAEIGTTV